MDIYINKPKRKAWISGIAGQDGSYLAEYLLELDYDVYGIIRRQSTPEHQESRINHLNGLIKTDYGDLLDVCSIERNLRLIKPDEVYNIAAQSHVRISFDIPQFTFQTNALGVLNLLEIYKNNCPYSKFYQASSSEMFGNSVDVDGYQRENTPMHPVSPYGIAKLAAFHYVNHYRRAYNLFAVNGILFNHESPRRGSNFVTNKIVKGAVEIKMGLLNKLELGNLDSYRDWGHSYDYVRAMKLIMDYKQPDNFVIATGISHSIRELCEFVFGELGLNYNNYILQNPKYVRSEELKYLQGDSTKARTLLEWKPKYTFETMLKEMIEFWIKFYEEKKY